MLHRGGVCRMLLVVVVVVVVLAPIVHSLIALGPSSDSHPECNRFCSEDQSPVCGSNGVLYPNECFLEYDNCVAGGGIEVKYPVDCRMTSEMEGLIDVAPVCDSNNVTHTNFCVLEKKRCKDPSIGFRHDGICGGEPRPECSLRCKKEWGQVCASDGRVYNNNCTLSYFQCLDPEITFLYNVPCPYSGMTDDTAVCGSDGKFYSNYCTLLRHQCRNPNIRLAPVDNCKGPNGETASFQDDTDEGMNPLGGDLQDTEGNFFPLEPGMDEEPPPASPPREGYMDREPAPPPDYTGIRDGTQDYPDNEREPPYVPDSGNEPPPYVPDNGPEPQYIPDNGPEPLPYVPDNGPEPQYIPDNGPEPAPYVPDNEREPPYIPDNGPEPPYDSDNVPESQYVPDDQLGPPRVPDNGPEPPSIPDNGPDNQGESPIVPDNGPESPYVPDDNQHEPPYDDQRRPLEFQ